MNVIEITRPQSADGLAVWTLIKKGGTLDLNSVYAYVLLCDYFQETCRIARMNGQIVGFTSAFVSPEEPDRLFIWQVAVHPAFRGQGLAANMLRDLIDTMWVKGGCRYVCATVSPNNAASRRLFTALAHAYDCELNESKEQGYSSGLFGDNQHEDEPLLTIGPLSTGK